MDAPRPETVDRRERDRPGAAASRPPGVRLAVGRPVSPPTPRRPGPRPSSGASRPRRSDDRDRAASAGALPAIGPRARRAATATAAAPEARLARLVVAGALVLLFATSAALLLKPADGGGMSAADRHAFEQRLTGYDNDVRSQLARLGPPGSVGRARVRTREAFAATEALGRQLRDFSGAAAARLQAATAAQLRYLDAVGSTLLNPRSPLRSELSARAIAARDALAAIERSKRPARKR